ncbi:hypothetical protein A234_09191 [Pseudomonas syringae pv. actinidiae ICMP 19101]|nr:hypothetical protein A234_09191 [Pseudomonas syringae pv. actinidiae ICMP 19101]
MFTEFNEPAEPQPKPSLH